VTNAYPNLIHCFLGPRHTSLPSNGLISGLGRRCCLGHGASAVYSFHDPVSTELALFINDSPFHVHYPVPAARSTAGGGTGICSAFVFFCFDCFYQTNYLNIQGPIFAKFFRVGRTTAVDKYMKSVFRSRKGRLPYCHGNWFCGPNWCRIHRIGLACDSLDGGVRQEVQVLRWTHANQLTDQLTIINGRLGG